jgi:hypothetical protein
MDKKECIVYFHYTKKDNTLFYVGISKSISTRRHLRKDRNEIWQKIVNESGFSCEIVHKNISMKEAIELEKKYISKYGRIDNNTGILANKTDGGEWVYGITQDSIEKMKRSYQEAIKKDPTIIERQKESYKKIREENPNVIKNSIAKELETYKKNPNIIERQKQSLKTTLKNNPQIIEKQRNTLKNTLKNNPDIVRKIVESNKKTREKNPLIKIRTIESYLLNHGVIILNQETGIYYLGYKDAAASINKPSHYLYSRISPSAARFNNTSFIRC